MNVKQFANVDSLYRDMETGIELPWHDYMARVVNRIGVNSIEPYIPFRIDDIREALKTDVYLNNLSMWKWEYAAECMVGLMLRNGIDIFSLSDRVCILKEAARILAKRKEN